MEILDDISTIYGVGRVGVKLGLKNTFLDMEDKDPNATMSYLIGEFNKRNLAFLEVKEGTRDGAGPIENQVDTQKEKFKKTFNGTWISNNGNNYNAANNDIAKGETDLASFG